MLAAKPPPATPTACSHFETVSGSFMIFRLWIHRADFIYEQKLPYTIAQAATVGLAFPDYAKRLLSPTVDSLRLLHIARPFGRRVETLAYRSVISAIGTALNQAGSDTGLKALRICLLLYPVGVSMRHAHSSCFLCVFFFFSTQFVGSEEVRRR